MKFVMSANEKELRAARQAERKEKKIAAAAEQEKNDRRYRSKVIIVVVVLVVLIIGALLINSDVFYTKTTALTVGTTKYTPAEVSYFYRSTYNTLYQNLYSQLGTSISMLLDTSKPLSEQEYPYDYDTDEKRTWADVVIETAQDDIVRVTSFYDAAVKEGFALTDEDRSTIDQTLANYRSYAASSGFSNVNKFYTAYFGKGVDEKLVSKLQEKIVLATNYYNKVLEDLTYTDEELAAYYAEHADELDYYAYYVYPINSTMDIFSELEGDELKTEVHNAAQEIVDAATDEDSFIEAVKAFAGENTVVSIALNHADNIGANIKDWVLDETRQPGDTTVIDLDSLSYALMFIEHDRNDYNTVDFRHILVQVGTEEDGVYTEENKEAALSYAESLMEEWEMDPTEENFSIMANNYSEDTGSQNNGGLYEQVTKYAMVHGVDHFLFHEGHVAEDCDLVYGESSSYIGYHLIYYVGENRRNCDILAENALRTEDFNAKAEELASAYTVVEGGGRRFIADL